MLDGREMVVVVMPDSASLTKEQAEVLDRRFEPYASYVNFFFLPDECVGDREYIEEMNVQILEEKPDVVVAVEVPPYLLKLLAAEVPVVLFHREKNGRLVLV